MPHEAQSCQPATRLSANPNGYKVANDERTNTTRLLAQSQSAATLVNCTKNENLTAKLRAATKKVKGKASVQSKSSDMEAADTAECG